LIALLFGWLRYGWHKRVLRHDTEALVFQRSYTRLQCLTCGLRIWQMGGLFSGRR
jgi:hypothetical protein